MITTTISEPAVGTISERQQSLAREPVPVTKPILVATDASQTADAAFTMARLLAHRSGAGVEVLTVLEPSMPLPPAVSLETPLFDPDVPRMEELRQRARHQLGAMVGDATGWLVDARYGDVAPTIHERTRKMGADLVIMGVSRHGLIDRLLAGETTAEVAQLTEVPVLATAADCDRLPRTVVIAVSPDSPAVPDSTLLGTLLSEVEMVHFVTVVQRSEALPPLPPLTDPLYVTDVSDACERVRGSLGVPRNAYRDPVAVAGDPATQILAFAGEVKADLIVVWQRRRWFLRRWIGRGLATRILRGTIASVLILPQPRKRRLPRSGDKAAAASRTETVADPMLWAERLAALSRRNAGRRVAVEIDDVALGAQTEARDFPFLGMDYDRHDGRIVIMLGDPAGGTAHLTHSVGAPLSVDVLEDAAGDTLAIRVENEPGQALVTFVA